MDSVHVTPTETLRSVLDERQWTPTELAWMLGYRMGGELASIQSAALRFRSGRI
jgi:hypothetical protein